MRDGNYAIGGIHYLDLVEESRARQITITKEAKKRLENMYEDVAKELATKAKNAGRGTITERWALDYKKSIEDTLDAMRRDQYDIISGSIKKAAENGVYIQQSLFNELNKEYSLGMDKTFRNVLSKVPQQAINELISGGIYKDGRGLSKRIWRDSKEFEKDIGYIVEKALGAKKSAIHLTEDLEKYVRGTARTDYNWGNCYPNLRSKKCSYEAQRLARTSISHSYQLATVRGCKGNPFIIGIQWLVSEYHRGDCTRCEKWATANDYGLGAGIYPAGHVPMDHPNGMCTVIPYITKSMDDIAGELKEWVNGGENAALDKWLGKTLVKSQDKDYNIYKIIQDSKDIPSWALEQHQQWSQEEIETLYYYSCDSYKDINGFLRGNIPAEDDTETNIDYISRAIAKSTISENITLWRGTYLENFEQSDFLLNTPVKKWKNKIISDKAFTSTSMLKSKGFKGSMQMEILVPKGYNGAYIAPVSEYASEYETLLPKGQQFKIIEAEIKENKYYVKVILETE